jgi:tRNA nucleotidyltransferase (CCA-adding enzyme)
MAFNETEGLVDPFNGQEDLEKKVLRCVGDPSARFSEDALRMLRAVRLSAQLGFTVESAAYDAIKANAPLLGRISAERIASEFNAILMSDRPETIYLLVDTGLISHIAPEFEACISTRQDSRYHSHNVGEHTVRSVALAEKDLIQRMSLFLHDIGKPFSISTDEKGGRHFSGHAAVSAEIADKILKRLKYPRKFSVMVRKLVLNHDIKFKNDDFCIRKLLAQYGEELLFRLIRIREADIGAQNPEFAGERLGRLAKFKESAERIIGEGACTSLERLAVKGSDLAAAGVTEEGRIIGEILGRLLDAVIEKPSLNEKDKLLELAASMKSE